MLCSKECVHYFDISMQVALHILSEIIRKEVNGSFPNRNYFTIQVYKKIRQYGMDYINSKKFIDDIPVITKDVSFDEEKEVIKTLEGYSVCDLRFRAFALNGFRMFPFGDNNRFYGLSFEKAGTSIHSACSLYLVGANGSGKTSLYSGMEYYCTGNISAAKSRGIYEDYYRDYIAHAKNIDKPNLKIFLHEEEESEENKQEVLSSLKEILPAFFCSEHEINEFCGKQQELTSFFYEQIGYGNIVRLKEHLEDEMSIIENYLDNKVDDLKRQQDISPKSKIALLKGIQSDVLKFMNHESSQEGLYYNSALHFAHQLLNKLSSIWNDELDMRIKRNTLEKMISQLYDIKEEIVRYYGEESTLYHLYNDYITELNNISNFSQEKPNIIVPRRFQGNEQNYQLGKIQIKDFQTKSRIILEWYIRIYEQFISQTKDRDVIKLIKDISDELAQIELTIDNVTETEETISNKYQLHRGHLKALIDGIEMELKKICNEILSNTERIKNETLSEFLMPSEEIKFTLSNEGKLYSTIYFKKGEKEKEISFEPKEYFNSFRYKFYCILLKIVAAFTVKKYFNFNFPLIFDDIFYSSDFSNRDKVGNFITSIYNVHNNIFKGIDSPLQIVFFTHDDLILEAAMKGTADIDNAIYGRLFFYNEVEEDDVRIYDGTEYYNLYIPFIEEEI